MAAQFVLLASLTLLLVTGVAAQDPLLAAPAGIDPNAASTTAEDDVSYSYVGCFADNDAYDLEVEITITGFTDKTDAEKVALCGAACASPAGQVCSPAVPTGPGPAGDSAGDSVAQACDDNGYDYMGIQQLMDFSSACFCGNSYGNIDTTYPSFFGESIKLNDVECGSDCSYGSTTCTGGKFANAIYYIHEGHKGYYIDSGCSIGSYIEGGPEYVAAHEGEITMQTMQLDPETMQPVPLPLEVPFTCDTCFAVGSSSDGMSSTSHYAKYNQGWSHYANNECTGSPSSDIPSWETDQFTNTIECSEVPCATECCSDYGAALNTLMFYFTNKVTPACNDVDKLFEKIETLQRKAECTDFPSLSHPLCNPLSVSALCATAEFPGMEDLPLTKCVKQSDYCSSLSTCDFDISQDGDVDVLDVIELIEYILA